MLKKEILDLLKNREYVSIATCDFAGKPNAAPKFYLKTEGNFIYLIDYHISRTWRNLKVNPQASVSLMDTERLVGYQIDGAVELIDSGPEYEKILKELLEKQVELSTSRVIEALNKGKTHRVFEVAIPEKFVIIKIKAQEVALIGLKGDIKREGV